MVFGESFQEPPPGNKPEGEAAISRMWRVCARGTAVGRFALVSQRTFLGAQSQQMTFVSGAARWASRTRASIARQ